MFFLLFLLLLNHHASNCIHYRMQFSSHFRLGKSHNRDSHALQVLLAGHIICACFGMRMGSSVHLNDNHFFVAEKVHNISANGHLPVEFTAERPILDGRPEYCLALRSILAQFPRTGAEHWVVGNEFVAFLRRHRFISG